MFESPQELVLCAFSGWSCRIHVDEAHPFGDPSFVHILKPVRIRRTFRSSSHPWLSLLSQNFVETDTIEMLILILTFETEIKPFL
jgi:hypothetical protein